MRREVIVAIILGVGVGLLVAFGLWRANLSFSPNSSPLPQEQTQDQTETVLSDLIITSPEDSSVVAKDTVTVEGATTPGASVVILTESGEYLTQAGADGSFEVEITLAPGPNEIMVKSYDGQEREATQTIAVVYSTELEE